MIPGVLWVVQYLSRMTGAQTSAEIAEACGMDPKTVWIWLSRMETIGLVRRYRPVGYPQPANKWEWLP